MQALGGICLDIISMHANSTLRPPACFRNDSSLSCPTLDAIANRNYSHSYNVKEEYGSFVRQVVPVRWKTIEAIRGKPAVSRLIS